jgi:HD superfamily phosphohydrolase
MHDCAHAPFSHTFENSYEHLEPNKPDEEKVYTNLERRLESLTGLRDEIERLPPGAPHEKLSAVILVELYEYAILAIDSSIDINLIVRMITGWHYKKTGSGKRYVEKCLIDMLNSKAIDVDKLDYIIRDTWASGVDNTSIDIHRLINAVSVGVYEGTKVLAFDKSALSIIQSVVDARNYLYRWVYSHHKVYYDSWLLQKAVESLADRYKMSIDEFQKRFFSIDSFMKRIEVGPDSFFLPNDSDLISLLKVEASRNENGYAYEWISRQHRMKPLWKSYAEYCRYFPDRREEKPDESDRLYKKLPDLLTSWERQRRTRLNFEVMETKTKTVKIHPHYIYVNMHGKTYTFTDFVKPLETVDYPFPYVFIDKRNAQFSDAIIEYVKNNL